MATRYILKRLDVIDTLLREREFSLALPLAANLEDTIATPSADDPVIQHLPIDVRERVRAVRWAAEVGAQLAHLVQIDRPRCGRPHSRRGPSAR